MHIAFAVLTGLILFSWIRSGFIWPFLISALAIVGSLALLAADPAVLGIMFLVGDVIAVAAWGWRRFQLQHLRQSRLHREESFQLGAERSLAQAAMQCERASH